MPQRTEDGTGTPRAGATAAYKPPYMVLGTEFWLLKEKYTLLTTESAFQPQYHLNSIFTGVRGSNSHQSTGDNSIETSIILVIWEKKAEYED